MNASVFWSDPMLQNATPQMRDMWFTFGVTSFARDYAEASVRVLQARVDELTKQNSAQQVELDKLKASMAKAQSVVKDMKDELTTAQLELRVFQAQAEAKTPTVQEEEDDDKDDIPSQDK